MGEIRVAEEAGRDAELARQTGYWYPDGAALLVISFDVGAKAVEVGGQGLDAPDHRAGFAEVGDGQSKGLALSVVELILVALDLAAQSLGEAHGGRAGQPFISVRSCAKCREGGKPCSRRETDREIHHRFCGARASTH